MNRLRFRLRTILLVVLVVGVVLAIALERWRRESYRLRAGHGPYLVVARAFRGPDAERHAYALAEELRADHRLPAFVHEPRRRHLPGAQRRPPEVVVVLGGARTLADAERLRSRVRTISPKSLAGASEAPIGLGRAFVTSNPNP